MASKKRTSASLRRARAAKARQRSLKRTWGTRTRAFCKQQNEARPGPAFQYQSLGTDPIGFRLLKVLPGTSKSDVHCELYHRSIHKEHGRYIAVSYAWGFKELEPPSIFIDRSQLKVRSNLFAFLKAYRESEISDKGAYLWIGAICINQHDVKERNHQVRVMASIYAGAREVMAWLGPSTSKSKWLFDFLGDQRETAQVEAAFSESNLRTRASVDFSVKLQFAHDDLLRRPYWTRMWVAQEVTLARQVWFYDGTKRLGPERLALFFGAVKNFRGESYVPWKIDEQITRLLRGCTSHGSQRIWKFEEALAEFGGSDCEDRRDRIYALLGLADIDAGKFSVDYAEPLESLLARVLKLNSHQRPFALARRLASVLGEYDTELANLMKYSARLYPLNVPVTLEFNSLGLLSNHVFDSIHITYRDVELHFRRLSTCHEEAHAWFLSRHAAEGDLVFRLDSPKEAPSTALSLPQTELGRPGSHKTSVGFLWHGKPSHLAHLSPKLKALYDALGLFDMASTCTVSRSAAGSYTLRIETMLNTVLQYAELLHVVEGTPGFRDRYYAESDGQAYSERNFRLPHDPVLKNPNLQQRSIPNRLLPTPNEGKRRQTTRRSRVRQRK